MRYQERGLVLAEVSSAQLFQYLGSLYAEVKVLTDENAMLRKKLVEATQAINKESLEGD